jgi:hypothetical protein
MPKAKKLKPKVKINLRKILTPAPEKRIIELEIEGNEAELPEPVIPPEPVELESTSLWRWFKSIW